MAKGKCPHGCDVTKTICSHLEKMLPNLREGTQFRDHETNAPGTRVLKYVPDVEALDNVSATSKAYSPSHEDVQSFISDLVKHEFSDDEIKVMVGRFIYTQSFKEIAEDLGHADVNSVFYTYKKCLTKIKKAMDEQTTDV